MQTIASRGAIIGQRVTARPSGKTASKSATRQPIKVNAVHTNQTGQGIMVDPDQYDPDANTGRGSGFVARAAGQQVMSSGAAFAPAGVRGGTARLDRVVRAPDGVTYDPDQYDPDANQRRGGGGGGGGGYSAPAAPAPSYGGSSFGGSTAAKPQRVVRAPDGVTYDPDQYDPDANQRSR